MAFDFGFWIILVLTASYYAMKADEAGCFGKKPNFSSSQDEENLQHNLHNRTCHCGMPYGSPHTCMYK